MKLPKKSVLLYGSLLILACILRSLAPTADPPPNLSWSGGCYSDEGFWVHNAVNALQFGNSIQDDWNNMYMSPLVHLLSYLSFACFGIGIVQARLISISCAALTLIVAAAWGHRQSPAHGRLVLALAGCNFLAIMYNRLALLETPLTLLLAAAAFAVAKPAGDWRADGYSLVAGVFAAGAYVTKSTSLFIVPVVFAVAVAPTPSRNPSHWLRRAVFVLVGMLLVLGPWAVLIYYPHYDLLQKYNDYYRFQQDWRPLPILKNIVLQPFFLYLLKNPLLLMSSLCGGLWTIVKVRGKKPTSSLELIAGSWMALEFCMLAVFGYRPLRYYVPILFPMTVLAAYWLLELSAFIQWLRDRKTAWILLTLVLSLPFVQAILVALIPLFHRLQLTIHGLSDNSSLPIAESWLFIALCPMLLYVLRTMTARRLRAGIITAYLAINLGQYAEWFATRRYDVAEARSYLTAHLLPTVIGGQWAPELCLGTPHRAVPIWKGYLNDNDPFSRYGLTYLLSWNYSLGNEYEHHKEWFPSVMNRSKVVKVFSIKDTEIFLSELK